MSGESKADETSQLHDQVQSIQRQLLEVQSFIDKEKAKDKAAIFIAYVLGKTVRQKKAEHHAASFITSICRGNIVRRTLSEQRKKNEILSTRQ